MGIETASRNQSRKRILSQLARYMGIETYLSYIVALCLPSRNLLAIWVLKRAIGSPCSAVLSGRNLLAIWVLKLVLEFVVQFLAEVATCSLYGY